MNRASETIGSSKVSFEDGDSESDSPSDNDSFTDNDSVTDSDEDEIPSLDVLVLSDPYRFSSFYI